jgi:AraC-like DNA-binding protein
MTTDILSDVLRAVRLTGAVFFSVEASAPWVAETPSASVLAPHVMPGSEHTIEYHLVTRGSCWGGIVDQAAERLEQGDIIVFPQGDAHVLASAPGMRGYPDPDMFQALGGARLPIRIEKDGGGAERTEVICGFLGCDARPFNPLLSALPRVIHVRARDRRDGMLEQLVRAALSESSAPKAGGQGVLARLSELLFIEVVRGHVATLPADGAGWLSGLRDEAVSRVLERLHARPAHPWTLDELAREVGSSRSVVAERFAHFVGIPPIQYLTQWRIQLAATLLRSTRYTLAEIAERVGYGSEAALSRAFKRAAGVAPAAYRQKNDGAATSS